MKPPPSWATSWPGSAWPRRRARARVDPRRARYLALITGPSRTADIERVLTIGAHGPERLIIVFFDE